MYSKAQAIEVVEKAEEVEIEKRNRAAWCSLSAQTEKAKVNYEVEAMHHDSVAEGIRKALTVLKLTIATEEES